VKRQRLEILFEDDNIVVVDKPSGLLSLPDRFDPTLPNIRTLMVERYGDIFMVHRLDRDTSGVMILAKNADTHKLLNHQFEYRTARKVYHALVTGIVERDAFPIDIPIDHDARRKGLMKPSARGKEAHTDVRVLERFRTASLIECTLVTGRTHQIRVHCSAIGHPLLVDPDYGSSREFMLSTIKRKFNLGKGETERPIIERLTLHAHTLTVDVPSDGSTTTKTFESPYPRDFNAALQVLRKYAAPYTTMFR
jgi:23S rRNA pseudouridine1911/1915/1917 synthase